MVRGDTNIGLKVDGYITNQKASPYPFLSDVRA
jgi:hypothetical protein